jgi:hypothetical protein
MKSQRLDSGRNRALSPKKGSIRNRVPKITGRAKTKHSDWNAQENSAPKSLNPLAPPWELKKGDKDKLATAMEL